MGKIKGFIKSNDFLMNELYFLARWGLLFIGWFIPVNQKSIIFVSLSGRNFDDSPKALYEEICKRDFFKDWKLIWAFKEPEKISIPRGEKVKFGTWKYWTTLLGTKVWVENGGMDLGINLNREKNIIVRTWHGSAIKLSEGYEKDKRMQVLSRYKKSLKTDTRSIRCIQTINELDYFSKIFKADKSTFLKCGLPRNDCLLHYTDENRRSIRKILGIPEDKKIILYMPTFRQYLTGENQEYYIKPPIHLEKWKKELGNEFVLLMRLHYMVANVLEIKNDGFVFDVCKYSPLPDLYTIADYLITDYSSSMYDFSITEKPILCFGYDYEEYEERVGFVYDFPNILPSPILKDENDVIQALKHMDYAEECKKTRFFKEHYAECFSGIASKTMVDEIQRRL